MQIKKIIIAFSLAISFTANTHACSRILHVENGMPVLVGRNMDWAGDLRTNLFVYPRGVKRNGQDTTNNLFWESKYASIVATAYDRITTDGMNEKGFAAHLLDLGATDYGKRDGKRPGISVYMWAQYYMDRFQTVNEAVKFTEENSIQISNPTGSKEHLAIEDSTGDSAIIEYINGQPVVYHDMNYKVMTNSPTYNLQLKNMRNYIGLGGEKLLPGTNGSKDRFVRGAYYEKYMRPATSALEDVTNVMTIMQNVAEPYGTADVGRDEYIPTIWEVVLDLTNKIYYFHDTKSLNSVYANLTKFNLTKGAPTMKLDLVNNPSFMGDVTDKFFEV